MNATNDILIIEDDAIMREALAEWVRGAGYSVRTAPDGSAGLAAVETSAPALFVTEMYMPGLNGSAVIAEMKQKAIPVIAISGLFGSGYAMSADGAVALGAARRLRNR